MKVVVTQPVGTQLFFEVESPQVTTLSHIADLVEQEEGVPSALQLFQYGTGQRAHLSDTLAVLTQDKEILDLKVFYDLDGQGGLRCETTKPHCGCMICCFECRCIKNYTCNCCCCEVGCTLL